MKRKKHVTFRVREDLLKGLNDRAKREGVKKGALLEKALVAFLRDEGGDLVELGSLPLQEGGSRPGDMETAIEKLTRQIEKLTGAIEQSGVRGTGVPQGVSRSGVQRATDVPQRATKQKSSPARANAKTAMYKGEERVVLDVLKELDLAHRRRTIGKRLDRGMSLEEAVEKG